MAYTKKYLQYLLEHLYILKMRLFKILSNFVWFLLQYKYFYFIKLSLNVVHSRKQSQSLYLTPQTSYFFSSYSYLHLNLWICSARLLARFDNRLTIIPSLCVGYDFLKFVFTFINSCNSYFCWNWNSYVFLVFSPKQLNYP